MWVFSLLRQNLSKVFCFHKMTFIKQINEGWQQWEPMQYNILPAGVTVLTVKRFRTQFASVCVSHWFSLFQAGEYSLWLCSLVSGNLYHQLDPSRVPLFSTKTKHWPQIGWQKRKPLWGTWCLAEEKVLVEMELSPKNKHVSTVSLKPDRSWW